MEYIGLAFSSIFVANVILTQFLGLCPFLGVSTKKSSALSMGVAVTLVITLSTVIAWLIYKYILLEYDLVYLSTIIYILVIASFVQLVEMIVKKFSPVIYQALGVYLPLITTNCAVLGVAIKATVELGDNYWSLGETIIYAVSISIGYALVIYIFSAIREEISASPIAKHWKGIPIALITAFIMAMIFSGFGGLA